MRRYVKSKPSKPAKKKKKRISKKQMKAYMEKEARKANLQRTYGNYRYWY